MLRLIVAPAMVLTTVLCASEGSAQPSPTTVTELGPLTTTGGARYRVLSREVGKPFIIDVVRVAAAGPASSAGKMPIVFVTDNDLMTTIVPAVARLGTSTFQFPSMIVVGIGYDTTAAKSPAEATVQGLARRATDFTPIHDDAYLAGVVPFTKQLFGIPWPADALLGRADRFLAFIDKELKPFIASQYPAADVADSTLVGHSLGGLFALHVLFTSPQSFARYIALSPGAAYGKEVLFREEAGLGNVAKRVFMGVGAHDTPDIAEAAPRLDAQIKTHARPLLRYSFKVFADETHESVFPAGIMAGLRAVFDAPGLPAGVAPPPRADSQAPAP